MATTLDAYSNLFDKSLPMFIRLQGLSGQQLAPSTYQELLNTLYKDSFADPAYVQKLRSETLIYPDAPPAKGGVGDPDYESAQAEGWKNYIQKQLEKAGISQGAAPTPTLNSPVNTPQQPSSTLPISNSGSYTPKYSNTGFSVPLGGIAYQELLDSGKHKDLTDQISNLFSTSSYKDPGFDEKRKNLYLQALDRLADDPSITTSNANYAREQWTGRKPQERIVMDIEVGDQPAAPVEQNNEVQKTPQLTEEEQYRKERDALLEKAEENLDEKIMPAPSPVEVTPAPGFENLVNQQRKEQAVEENKLTTSSPTVEQQAQTTQEAFQGLVNNARTGDTQVAGAPAALALPVGLGVGGAILTGIGAKEGGQALQNAADNIQELLTPSANVPEESTPNPLIETLQEAAPTVMGIFGLGGKKKTTGPTKATYGGKSQEQIKKEKELEDFKRNLPPATQGQPGRGRGMGDTWEGPQASVTSGQRSEKIASRSSFTEPTRTTGSRSEKLAAASSSSSDSSRTKGSRSDAFGALVNSSREEKLRGFA